MVRSPRWGPYHVMKYLRSQAKKLSLLALFALALQFGLSFGHFHQDTAVAAISGPASASQASTPDTDHDQDTHRDLCAICATVAMANTLIAATAPMLPVPLPVATLQITSRFESITPDPRRGAFRSRAPPRSSLE